MGAWWGEGALRPLLQTSGSRPQRPDELIAGGVCRGSGAWVCSSSEEGRSVRMNQAEVHKLVSKLRFHVQPKPFRIRGTFEGTSRSAVRDNSK